MLCLVILAVHGGMHSPIQGSETQARRHRAWFVLALFAWFVLVVASWAWQEIRLQAAGAATPRLHGLNILAHLVCGGLGAVLLHSGFRRFRRWRNSLLASEERYRLISAVANDYVFSSAVAPDGRLQLQWVAGAFTEITGYTFEEYVATGGWRPKVHPDDVARDAQDMDVLRNNRPLRTELRTISKSGAAVWVEVSAHPVWDPAQNRLAGIYGAVKNITRRKQAEAETQATYGTLRQFVDSVPAFASYVDQDERYQFVNRYYEDWFQKPREHFVGRKLAEVHRPATYATMQSYSRQALAGQTVHYEHEMTGRDGKYYCFDVHYIPRRTSDGSVQGYFTLVFDITERVLRERQLLRTQRLESVGRLASGIAHDLNNILAPMLLGPDLLLESIHDPGQRQLLELIKSSATRGAGVLRQLLMFGRGEPEVYADLQLGPLIRELLLIVAETFPKNIHVSQNLAPDLPFVHGNVTHLHQVLLNLCINARDAMPAGGRLRLTARVENVEADQARNCGGTAAGPHVVLGVEDTGTGIPPEILDKIFDPFFTTKPAGTGTGLGLSTVLGIVRSHRGFIRVDSQPDRGTRFEVFLPACPGAGAGASAPAAASLPDGRGETILLVDDEDSSRQAARQTLERHGYRVQEARNGAEALALYERDPGSVQLVLTDLMMPVMDGVTLLRRLRQVTPDLKAIAITGGLSQTEMEKALDSESAGFLLKPFGAAALLDSVRQALSAR